MGKLGYMAPEHARGEDVDARSDQFATAQMLYELLTGERYYGRRSARQIWQVVGRGLVPPGLDQLDDDLARVLRKALDPLPADRFDGCGEFHDTLVECELDRRWSVGPRDISALLDRAMPGRRLDREATLARYLQMQAPKSRFSADTASLVPAPGGGPSEDELSTTSGDAVADTSLHGDATQVASAPITELESQIATVAHQRVEPTMVLRRADDDLALVSRPRAHAPPAKRSRLLPIAAGVVLALVAVGGMSAVLLDGSPPPGHVATGPTGVVTSGVGTPTSDGVGTDGASTAAAAADTAEVADVVAADDLRASDDDRLGPEKATEDPAADVDASDDDATDDGAADAPPPDGPAAAPGASADEGPAGSVNDRDPGHGHNGAPPDDTVVKLEGLLELEPGQHSVQVRRDGRRGESVELTLAAAEARTVVLELASPAAAAPAVQTRVAGHQQDGASVSDTNAPQVLLWTGAGVMGAGAAFALVAGVVGTVGYAARFLGTTVVPASARFAGGLVGDAAMTAAVIAMVGGMTIGGALLVTEG